MLRPAGSSRRLPLIPIKRNCSAMMKRYSSLQTISGDLNLYAGKPLHASNRSL